MRDALAKAIMSYFLNSADENRLKALFADESEIFFFDFDGTVTKTELLPEIGRELGLFDELDILTRQTLMGELSFADSFRNRVEILSSVDVTKVNNIVSSIPKFEKIISWISDNRHRSIIATGNLDIWLHDWVSTAGIYTFASSGKLGGSKVELINILEKSSLRQLFPDHKIIFVGDGANDAGLMRLADVGISSELVHRVPDSLFETCDIIVTSEEALCMTLNQF